MPGPVLGKAASRRCLPRACGIHRCRPGLSPVSPGSQLLGSDVELGGHVTLRSGPVGGEQVPGRGGWLPSRVHGLAFMRGTCHRGPSCARPDGAGGPGIQGRAQGTFLPDSCCAGWVTAGRGALQATGKAGLARGTASRILWLQESRRALCTERVQGPRPGLRKADGPRGRGRDLTT